MVDQIDYEIIKALEINSRLSYTEIGKIVHLSTSAVRERIIRLEETNIILSYNAKIDYTLLGFGLEAIILIKAHKGKLKALSKKVLEFNEVKEALSIMGEYNIHVKGLFKDMKHLQKFLDDLLPYGDTVTLLSHQILPDRLK